MLGFTLFMSSSIDEIFAYFFVELNSETLIGITRRTSLTNAMRKKIGLAPDETLVNN